VAAAIYRVYLFPAAAQVRLDPTGRYQVRIAAADTGTGAATALAQIAADALGVPLQLVRLEIGDSALPRAFGAAGSSGTVSWGWGHRRCGATAARTVAQ
jgi:xanthine dehydrogenase YagR molybdenum-binding subunit